MLLDYMHEDLNEATEEDRAEQRKLVVKRAREEEETKGMSAEEAWREFRRCNRSFIVDCFYGNTRSQLTCTNCMKRSSSWEPFSVLSLPIPKFLDMNFVFIRVDGAIFELNYRISDRTSFLDLMEYAKGFE